MTHKNPQKVIITVSKFDFDGERCRYHKGVNGGKKYTSVGYGASEYGAASPCDNEKEVQSSIKSFKECILKHGDIPILNDERVKTKLTDFF